MSVIDGMNRRLEERRLAEEDNRGVMEFRDLLHDYFCECESMKSQQQAGRHAEWRRWISAAVLREASAGLLLAELERRKLHSSATADRQGNVKT